MGTAYSLSTHVLPKIPKIYPDHVYNEHPTLTKFLEKGERQAGGLSYSPNRIAVKDGTSTWFAGTTMAAAISGASQTNRLLNANFYWTNVITPITLTYEELVKGDEAPLAIITSLEVKKKQAELDHHDSMSSGFLNGVAAGGTQPYGLVVLVTPSSTFGGVVPGTDTDYVSNTVTAATNFNGKSTIQNAYQACLWNGRRPNICPTTQALWSRAANIFESDIHYQAAGKTANRGLDEINFRNMSIYMDRDMAASQLWMLNEETIHLYKHSKYFEEYKAPEVPTAGADIWVGEVGYILSSFIVAADERRVHGGYLALSA